MAYNKEVVRLSVAVSPETNHKLEVLSKRMNISKTKVVNQIIDTYIDMMSSAWDMLSNPEAISAMAKLSKQFTDRGMPNVTFDEKEAMELHDLMDEVPDELKEILTKK